ncbi:MAG TPA: hypothetical protein VN836_06175 [Verrucomicrobiae bacterium]|nr:hypothetical protein [Verrucomicrobiae bacterium]
MSGKRSNWYIPPDWAFLFGLWVIIPATVILAGASLPVLSRMKTADVFDLYWGGLGFGFSGIVLLFFARLPLYRQRRFWTFGPSTLSGFHRKLYYLAHTAIVAALLLLGAVWLRVK